MNEYSSVQKYDLYIFDFDFTLFDTSKAQAYCIRSVLETFDIGNVDDAAIQRSMGVPLRETFGQYTDDPEKIGLMERMFWQTPAEVLAEWAEPCCNAIQTVNVLCAGGANLALVTGNSRDRVQAILKRFSLDGMFDLSICAGELTNQKPHPEGLLKCLSHFQNIDKNQVVYVGDHLYDIMAAQRCGIAVVAVASGTLSRQELLQYRPTHVIGYLSELL